MEISGALASISTLTEMIKLGLDAKDAKKRQEILTAANQTLSELTKNLLAANQSALEYQAQAVEAHRLIEKIKDWDSEKDRYTPLQTPVGSIFYVYKEPVEIGQSAVKFCANCYHRGEKSVLGKKNIMPGRVVILECHVCSTYIVDVGVLRPEHAGLLT